MTRDFYWKLDVKAFLAMFRYISLEELGYLVIVKCLCHEFGGYLSADGDTPTLDEEAGMLGVDLATHDRMLDRLLKLGLLARDRRGVLYSPDLICELELREKRRQSGRRGGNPRLLNQEVNQIVTITMDSDSDSTSDGDEEGLEGEGGQPPVFGEETVEYKLAYLLRHLVLENNGRAAVPDGTPEDLASWALAMRRILGLHYEPREIEDVIRWCQDDTFWLKIILTADNLAQHFEQLWHQTDNA